MSQNYYQVLELNNNNPTEADIKKAYKRLALKYHPDKNKDPEAVEKFQKIAQAYQYLTNKSTQTINPNDLFTQFFNTHEVVNANHIFGSPQMFGSPLFNNGTYRNINPSNCSMRSSNIRISNGKRIEITTEIINGIKRQTVKTTNLKK